MRGPFAASVAVVALCGIASVARADTPSLFDAALERVDSSGAMRLDLTHPATRAAWTHDVRDRVVDVEIPPGMAGEGETTCSGRGALGLTRRGAASRVELTLHSDTGGWFTVHHRDQRAAGFRLPPGEHRRRVLLKGGEVGSSPVLRVRGPSGFAIYELAYNATTCPLSQDAGAPVVAADMALLPPKSALRWIAAAREGERLFVAARATDSRARLALRISGDDGRVDERLVRLSSAVAQIEIPLSVGVRRIDLVAAAGHVEVTRAEIARGPAPEASLPVVDNVVVLLIDTLRADRLAPFAPRTRVRTPALGTAVARGGIVFSAAYSQSNWTKPSVASLLTGLMPWQHGGTTHRAVIDESVPFVTEHLQLHGIVTAAFVSNGYVSSRFGIARGFSHFEHSEVTGRSRGPDLVRGLLRWLDRDRRGERFFAYVHTTDVHSPYAAPRAILEQYDPLPYHGPMTFEGDPLLLRRIQSGEIVPDGRDRQRLVAMYDAGVAAHDAVIEALFAGLASRDLLDRTLVVVLADHGEELFDHGSVGHGGERLWDEQVHVPLVAWWPGVSAQRIEEAVGLVDVTPTLMDALGVEQPSWLAGRSLARLLAGDEGPTSVVVTGARGWTAVVAADHKMHWDGRLGSPMRVYARGAVERRDVAGDRPFATRHLRRELGAVRARTPARAMAAQPEVDEHTAAALRALGYVDDHSH